MQDFLVEGFLLEHAPDRVLVAWGPFETAAGRLPDRLGCYAPDFFLDDPMPWHHPAGWREMTRARLAEALGPAPAPPAVSWTAPSRDAYIASYRTVMQAIDEGVVTKAVPVLVEHGRAVRAGDGGGAGLVHALLARALAVTGASFVYGRWGRDEGLLGATPEILFRAAGRRVETAAVASTRPLAAADELLTDRKELAEHQSVVDDMTTALARFGRVQTGPLEVLRLATMAHLRTAITLHAEQPACLPALVAALHPTSALGVAPRSAGFALLRALDRGVARGRFGAPIGVEWPDGRAACLVAIRGVQWRDTAVALAAGGGVIAPSQLDREWDELALKRAAVKRMLGL